jgi:hypothetical protein
MPSDIFWRNWRPEEDNVEEKGEALESKKSYAISVCLTINQRHKEEQRRVYKVNTTCLHGND